MMHKKNILVIMPFFYGYENEIIGTLKANYDVVYLKSEIPLRYIYSFILFFLPVFASFLRNTYSLRLANFVIRKRIDTVFIIRGGGLTASFFENISTIKDLKIFNYQWDSVKNNPNSLMISNYTDLNFTFDRFDSLTYCLKYIPLFYSSACLKYRCPSKKKEKEVLFVGSYRYDRYLTLKKISKELNEKGFVLQIYLYVPFFIFVKEILIKRAKVKLVDVKFRKISKAKVYELMQKTVAILDISSPNQSGITIRTIESLILEKKIITTNNYLVEEPFYCSDNCCFYDSNSLSPFDNIDSFYNKSFDSSKNKLLLSVSEWLGRLGVIKETK